MSSSPWVAHVKQYQQQHGVSYKEAMSLARPSYTPVSSGGKFSIHKAHKALKRKHVGRKIQNSVHRAQKFADDNAGLISEMDSQFGTDITGAVRQGNSAIGSAEQYASQVQGGKFKLKNAIRKTVHSVKRAKQIARVAGPVLSVVAPEVGLPIMALNNATGGRVAKASKGGSFKPHGGSFQVHGGAVGGCVNCPTCGSSTQNRSESTIIHPMHPAFNPPKPKPLRDRNHTN